MHAMGGVIDLRRLGGLRRRMPMTHATFLIGDWVGGRRPLSGFWSKDAILPSAIAAAADRGRGLRRMVLALAGRGGTDLALHVPRLFPRLPRAGEDSRRGGSTPTSRPA